MTKYVLVAGASMPGINPQQGGELRSDPFGKGVKSYTGISGPAPFLSASCGPLVGPAEYGTGKISIVPMEMEPAPFLMGPGLFLLGPMNPI